MCIKTPVVFYVSPPHWWLIDACHLKLAQIGSVCSLGFFITDDNECMSEVSHQAFHVLKLIVMQWDSGWKAWWCLTACSIPDWLQPCKIGKYKIYLGPQHICPCLKTVTYSHLNKAKFACGSARAILDLKKIFSMSLFQCRKCSLVYNSSNLNNKTTCCHFSTVYCDVGASQICTKCLSG